MFESEKLSGSVAVITGASSGFGRGTALRLAELGAYVVLAARRNEVLDQLAAEINQSGGSALAVETDVSNADDVLSLAEKAIARFGGFDVWINNVGIGALGLFWDIPLKDHARIVDVNLTGLINGAHTALRHFIGRNKGVLINVGSIDSQVALAYQASYASTKAAVLSLSRSLNQELRLIGQDDIKVGTIMPWAVDTPWWTHAANYTGHAPRMAAMDDPEIVIEAIVAACTDPKEEQPVGLTARASDLSHHLFPDLTETLSANIANAEVKKAMSAPHSTGAIYEPMVEGVSVYGGIRERMKAEDLARN